MSVFYLDASALVKRYAVEAGSTWVQEQFRAPQRHVFLTSHITVVEVAAALAAKVRNTPGLTSQDSHRLLSRFLLDVASDLLLIPVQNQVVNTAVQLTQRHPLRGYDAVQLASALVAYELLRQRGALSSQTSGPTFLFVASDRVLLRAAQAEGLSAFDPTRAV